MEGKAVEWYLKAAEQGYVAAQFNLGSLHTVAEAGGETSGAATKTALSSPAKDEAPQKPTAGPATKSASDTSSDKTESKGAEAALRAGTDDGKTDVTTQRFALGASAMVTASTSPASPAAETKAPAASPPVTLLNAQPSESKADAPVEVASVAGAAKDAGKPEAKADAKAVQRPVPGVDSELRRQQSHHHQSYGGKDGQLHGAGCERGNREARSGRLHQRVRQGVKRLASSPSQSQALEKAFELCPRVELKP